ncbi:hypothetical protein GCK72_015321 [Caenorhabditis remanei]|nr:hypothetical protein GCK72_015321 [Caenorhabditis remanei]KAF1758861.1 hypothetical protein GCK72_015321 [Caenorhabditis remanei]
MNTQVPKGNTINNTTTEYIYQPQDNYATDMAMSLFNETPITHNQTQKAEKKKDAYTFHFAKGSAPVINIYKKD